MGTPFLLLSLCVYAICKFIAFCEKQVLICSMSEWIEKDKERKRIVIWSMVDGRVNQKAQLDCNVPWSLTSKWPKGSSIYTLLHCKSNSNVMILLFWHPSLVALCPNIIKNTSKNHHIKFSICFLFITNPKSNNNSHIFRSHSINIIIKFSCHFPCSQQPHISYENVSASYSFFVSSSSSFSLFSISTDFCRMGKKRPSFENFKVENATNFAV